MAMARAAAQLIEGDVRHSCGLPVECVIADTCIGGVAEAAQCAEKFKKKGVGLSINVTPCWCYGSETMDMDPLIPKAVWGFNGTERPGAVYLAAVLAAHNQKGLPAFGIYGRDVQDAGDSAIPGDVREALLRFVRAGLAVGTMRGNSYLAMGGTSMGIAGSIVDQDFFQRYLGMRTESVDMSIFLGRMLTETYDKQEFERAHAWVREWCREGFDPNAPAAQRSREQKDEDWRTSVKMALIARDLMVGNPRLAEMGFGEEAEGHNAIAGGFQGQRQWTDYYPNGDFMEALLCSTFDWNGIRQPFIVATENDSLNGAAMLFGHLLTGTAQLFSDVRTYWSPDAIARVSGLKLDEGVIHLINSGPSALDWTGEVDGIGGDPSVRPYWELGPDDPRKCLDATRWCASDVGYFRGGGWSTDFTTRSPMDVTMCRINLVAGLGPVLQIAEGEVVGLPAEVHDKLDLRTNPTWPTTWFRPRLTGCAPFDSVYSVMQNWGANHGAICYGHIGADLITLASMLRIPVDMHNLPSEKVFRPSAWARFGAMDPQGADYRACAAYGPVYG
jgi:L-fucose isomerase